MSMSELSECEQAVIHLVMWPDRFQWSVRNTGGATNQTFTSPSNTSLGGTLEPPRGGEFRSCWSETKALMKLSWLMNWFLWKKKKMESFALARLIVWPDRLRVRKLARRCWSGCKLGRAVYMFTRALSDQMKPEAHQWFTSRHFGVRVSRPTLNTISDAPSRLASRTHQCGSLGLTGVRVYELVTH